MSERRRRSSSSEGRRLVADFIACNGHGICRDILPDNIRLDEWGYPIVTNEIVFSEDLSDAKRAVHLCPELALRLEEIKEQRRDPVTRQCPRRSGAHPGPGLT
jgi:ferredoxin